MKQTIDRFEPVVAERHEPSKGRLSNLLAAFLGILAVVLFWFDRSKSRHQEEQQSLAEPPTLPDRSTPPTPEDRKQSDAAPGPAITRPAPEDVARARADETPGAKGALMMIVAETQRDDVLGLAAELAYRLFMAAFPFAIFLVALGGTIARAVGVQNPAEQVTTQLQPYLPADVASILGGQIERVVQQQNPGLLSIGAISALFFAMGGMNAAIKGLNRVVGVEDRRPFWRRYAISFVLTVFGAALVLASAGLLVGGQVAGTQLAQSLGVEAGFASTFSIVRWPLAFLLLVAATFVVYRFAPNLRAPWHWLAFGAVLFSIGWLVATVGFAFWVSSFGSYAATYGALASVAVLLVWLYLSGVIFLLAAEVAVILAERSRPGQLEAQRRKAMATNDDRAKPGSKPEQSKERSKDQPKAERPKAA